MFPILLFSSISLHWSLRKAFLSFLAILWNSAFKWVYCSFSPLPFTSLLFSAVCKASSDNHFAFLHFFFLRMVLITDSCAMSWISTHSSSGTLSDQIPWIYLSLLTTTVVSGLIYVIPAWSSDFPYFLQFKSEFGNKEFMILATVRSWSCFCWLYRASPSLAAKNIVNLISVLTIWWWPCVESSLALLEEDVCYDQCISMLSYWKKWWESMVVELKTVWVIPNTWLSNLFANELEDKIHDTFLKRLSHFIPLY